MRILYHPKFYGIPFIFTINATAGTSYSLPLASGYSYSSRVHWGDGSRSKITAYNDPDNAHVYSSSGSKTVKIYGTCQVFGFYASSHHTGTFPLRTAITSVIQWGECDFRKLDFENAVNLSSIPTGAITGVSHIESLAGFLYGCTSMTCAIDEHWFDNCGTATSAVGTFGFSGVTGVNGWIPVNIFKPLVNVTANGFWSAFQSCPGLSNHQIPEDLFRFNTKISSSAFRDCFNGTHITGSLPADLFRYNTEVSSDAFFQAFQGTAISGLLPSDFFRYNIKASSRAFAGTFSGCSGLAGSIPSDFFRYNISASTSAFSSTFYGCSGLTGSIPAGLFRYNTSVTGFISTFGGCSGLSGAVPADLFRYNTQVNSFASVFYGCSGLTSLSADLFRYNTAVTSFESALMGCSGLTTLPSDLFRYNTVVTNLRAVLKGSGITAINSGLFDYNTLAQNFESAFENCIFTSIPSALFAGNTAAITFKLTFGGCTALETVPAELFAANSLVTTFEGTFNGCVKLQQNRNIFFSDANRDTRFLNRSINFTNCFNRASFTGVQGEAPCLWNCAFGSGTPVKTDCWNGAGNSAASLSNYPDIPVAWV
jgi:hypothetical protein